MTRTLQSYVQDAWWSPAKGTAGVEAKDAVTGESVALEPGGLHAMLMRLQEPMTEGETFPLTLLFDDGGEVTVEVTILGIAARGPED